MATAVKDVDIEKMGSSKDTARGSCPRCHKRTTKGYIQMTVSKYGEEKSARGAKHIKSRGRSMCGTCIKEVWTKLNEKFTEELDR